MRNIDRSDMGIHVGYSGKTLNTYREHDIGSLVLLRWHIGHNASISRIDLAFDLKDTPMSISALYDMLERKEASTSAKTYNLIVGSDGGKTLYVGSRTSEAFMRIYDKGVESGEGGNWTRVELELKGSKARFAAYTMANESDDRAYQWAQGWLNGFVAFPDPTWRSLMVAEAIPMARANKPEADTKKWLLETVAPAMAKYMNRTGDYKCLVEFMAILRSGDDSA
jgi:DNA relaxase NicK